MGFRVFSGGLIFSLVLSGLMSSPALGACRTDAPQARAFALGHGSCPSGYYRSGGACVPSGGHPRFAFSAPEGSCPSGYYRSGAACVASSDRSCDAFAQMGGSCPSGYHRSGLACLSN
ncbi:MAG TPA: hypothetical protein DCY52_02735 [Methylococcaceae bacterium]|jgi:hypothetical protein|nr:hypothetical protein [Methylococcaceae bacterium]